MVIYPYKNGSASAKALAEGLGIKRAKREGKPLRGHLVVNWGCSHIERDVGNKILNDPLNVHAAANKLATFKYFDLDGVPTVDWTLEKHKAMEWMQQGFDVVIRHKLSGHSGEGIEVFPHDKAIFDLPNAPLYTKYTKKKDEYRIHVFRGEVIFQQRKARKKDVPDEKVNWRVRNLAGGFIFANDGILAPESVLDAAIRAVASLGLDFGAADVGFKDDQAVVYEVNTACGLQSKTLETYVNKFKEFL